MKILFYNYSMGSGGIERTIASLSAEFVREHEVTLVQYTDTPPFYELDSRVKHLPLGLDASGNVVIRVFKLYRALRSIFKEIRPDVIFCMNKTHLGVVIRASKKTCRAAVIGAERSNPLKHMTKRDLRLRKKSVRADGFVFQTERAASAYPEETRKKGIVIHNAICNPDVFEDTHPEKKNLFVSVGRLERVKGYDLLIRAFSQIAPELPDWSLVIYGNGSQKDAIHAQIDSLGLSDRVTLAGEDLHAYRKVKACEIFVLSSRSEGMPNTLLEAMACGLACIAADCPNGPKELIQNGFNGLLVPSEDIDALATAMKTLARSGDLRATLSSNAIKARESHAIGAIANAWLSYAAERLSLKRST